MQAKWKLEDQKAGKLNQENNLKQNTNTTDKTNRTNKTSHLSKEGNENRRQINSPRDTVN